MQGQILEIYTRVYPSYNFDIGRCLCNVEIRYLGDDEKISDVLIFSCHYCIDIGIQISTSSSSSSSTYFIATFHKFFLQNTYKEDK